MDVCVYTQVKELYLPIFIYFLQKVNERRFHVSYSPFSPTSEILAQNEINGPRSVWWKPA